MLMTCRHDDKVDGAEVEAVEHVLRVAGHREAGLVVAEVAEREGDLCSITHTQTKRIYRCNDST